ncbi:MAG: tRNA uridine-5-carboxymethylaminomethyl(34) synthesis GTPase MnmE, partial [Synergistaceae bacterium]|nr:tRNA uridine-5-carboxymethylaminomethyl(34) synthesis GTPase MnmE [Synergistaceae bacterium]
MAESTIAAISTALGEGGIAIVRVSGPDAVSISTKILTRKNFDIPGRLYLTSLIDGGGNILDRVLAVRFEAPNSYTGEDIVEVHTHGGIFVASLCLEMLIANGAELAQPGEFTRRAFTGGR